jgi:hypothetical protein
MQYWLANSGHSRDPHVPPRDDWQARFREWHGEHGQVHMFSRRPRIKPGDVLIYHAVGSALAFGESRIFAVASVLSAPEASGHVQWPWKVERRVMHGVPDLALAPTLTEIGVSASSLRRHSHIALTEEQGRRAESLITSATQGGSPSAGYDARAHLRSLVGRPLQTAGSERPNRILHLSSDEVEVATGKSPGGELVPISWVQKAGDRLYADGSLRVSPSEIGYRSAFIGAVLRTLPGVVVERRPLRLVLERTRFLMTAWAQDTWRQYELDGMQGDPFRHTAGRRFRQYGLRAGDAVYVVGQHAGQLLLIGRLHVTAVVDRAEAEKRLGQPLWQAPDHLIGAPPWSSVRFDRVAPESVARSLRMVDGAPLAFRPQTDYQLQAQALRTDRWLSDASAAVLDEILDAEAPASEEARAVSEALRPGRRRRGGERLSAPARRAVERHAMARAAQQLRSAGWDVEDCSGTHPFDFLARRPSERLFVEVKGSTGSGDRMLTAGEVEHARQHPSECALIIVTAIQLDVRRPGRPKANGGIVRVVRPWNAPAEQLRAVAYEYTS